MRPVAVDLTYIPVVGHALSAAFQAPFCAGAMAVVGGALAYLVVKTLINATQLLKLLAKLAELVAAAMRTSFRMWRTSSRASSEKCGSSSQTRSTA